MNKTLRISLGFISVLSMTALPVYSSLAYYDPYANTQTIVGDPNTIVCQGLALVGIGCASAAPSTYQPGTGFPLSTTPTPSNAPDSKSAISNATAPKDLNGTKINIVSVPGSPEIYELVDGQKHPFPSLAVYYDYGYTLAMIQPITQDQLDKYPRANLLKVKGSSNVYYLTEAGLLRQVYNPKTIFNIYGDRPEDVITISQKEFNFYPTNQYVYQIAPLNLDVFQVSAEGKRYLTPMAVQRLGITPNQIAPVTQQELDSYKVLAPVID